MAVIFSHLPDSLFGPLAGPNRQIYAMVLARLHDLFYGGPASAVLPSKESVRNEIEEAIAAHAMREWIRVDGDLQTLLSVFEEVDEHLSRIDAFRASLERRVAERTEASRSPLADEMAPTISPRPEIGANNSMQR